MAKTFTVKLKGSAAELVEKARAAAEQAGSTFSGNEVCGQFKGFGVAGHYTVENQTVLVTVVDKPWIAPWSMVESKITSFFST